MPDSERSKDRPYTKKPKPPTRLVQMKLELELCEAIEETGQEGLREFHEMLACCLKYAVWKFANGGGPEEEMSPGNDFDHRGYPKWKEDFRKWKAGRLLSMPCRERVQ
jgi:hypothetical protein